MKLFRIENPNIESSPDGENSHEQLIGQWFSTDLNYVYNYLAKNQRKKVGRLMEKVNGARLIVLDVPEEELGGFHAKQHSIAQNMDIEYDNYIIPTPKRVDYGEVAISLDDLDMVGGSFLKLQQAKEAIRDKLIAFNI